MGLAKKGKKKKIKQKKQKEKENKKKKTKKKWRSSANAALLDQSVVERHRAPEPECRVQCRRKS